MQLFSEKSFIVNYELRKSVSRQNSPCKNTFIIIMELFFFRKYLGIKFLRQKNRTAVLYQNCGSYLAKDSKMTGLTGEWSMKVKKVFSRGAQLLSEKIKKGIDVRIQIISKIDDPDAYGSERLVIENAWFNELTLQKFENAKMIDEEYSGGFTDYYFPDLVKVR